MHRLPQVHRVEEDGPKTLRAVWRTPIVLPVTDSFQRYGAHRMKHEHLVLQAVAIFGTRRVTLGATVLAMELALGGSRAMYTRALANCGVDTGGTLTGGLWLHDLAGHHDVGATSLVGAAQAAEAGEGHERFPAARFRCARLRGTSTSGSIYVFNVHRSSEQQSEKRCGGGAGSDEHVVALSLDGDEESDLRPLRSANQQRAWRMPNLPSHLRQYMSKRLSPPVIEHSDLRI